MAVHVEPQQQRQQGGSGSVRNMTLDGYTQASAVAKPPLGASYEALEANFLRNFRGTRPADLEEESRAAAARQRETLLLDQYAAQVVEAMNDRED